MSTRVNSSTFIPIRFGMVIVIVLSCAVDYITRVNINIAIVAMVKSHPHAHNVSAGTCPFEGTPSGSNSSFPIIHDQSHNVVNPNLTYDWSPKTQGIVLGSFWYSYMCMQVPSGRMAEEFGGKWIVAVSLLGSALINFITPFITGSLAVLVASRVVLGILQGGIFPACYAMLYTWMPQKERSFSLACMDVGGTLGSIVAASLSGYLSEHGFAGGWPSSFYVSGLISAITFAIWVAWTHSFPEEHPFITETELRYIQQTRGTGKNALGAISNKLRGPVPWREILTSAPVLAVISSKFSLGWTFFTILSKLPGYLNDVLHVAPTENGLLNASLYTAAIMSSVSSGLISEKLIQAGYISRTRCRKCFASLASIGAAICLATVPSVGCNKTFVMSLFIFANFAMGCASGGDGPVPSELTTNYPATVFAIANMVSCSSGFIAPYVIGMILESNAGDLQFLWSIVFYMAAELATMGILVFITFGEVGAGSTGSVVANRLSETYKVLLLEAGGEPYFGTYTPGNALFMLTQPEVQWNFQTVPQKHACLAMNNHACNWHRGIGLGGTSNLNYMMYARGHPEDYNYWAKFTGDNRWKYENVLPYFKKSENFECQDELDEETSKYHARHGPLTVRYADYKGLAHHVLSAAKEYGYPTIDYNADFPQGFAVIQNTFQSNGFRMGTNQAFLKPIRNTRDNLTIHKFSLAHKVLFEEGTKKVIGVEYSRHGRIRVAYAKKEVIISAGAINSPKILMLSGIGPAEHLRSLNIDVKLDLPGVGKNLQDHIGSFVGPFIMNDTVSYHPDRDLTLSMFLDFWLRGKGVLNTVGSDASGFVSSSRAVAMGEKHWPDIQYITTGYAVSDGLVSGFEKAFNFKPNVLQKYYEKAKGKDSFHIIPILNRPITRGDILLKSNDPNEYPLIDPKYFDDESDLKTFAESIKLAVNFVENSKTFQAFDARLIDTPFPGCEKHKPKSDAYYECYGRHFSQTIWHYSGTCAMGKAGSKDAVLNSELQVIGMENLRVMDASVMPTVVSANTNAACIMIGELGADLIKQKHGEDVAKGNALPDHEEL